MTNAQLTFPAPGRGRWRLDQDHAERPTRRIGWDCWTGTEAGSRAGYALIGAATRCIRIVHVHGWPYVQVEMIGGTETDELSKRDRSARIALEDRTWCDIVDTWFDSERGDFVDRCLTLQMSLDEPTEDLKGRAEDVLAAGDLATDGMSTHFKLVAGLLGAGLFLGAHAVGSERQDALAGLAGASPGSSEPLELAAAVAITLGDDAHHITSGRSAPSCSIHPKPHGNSAAISNCSDRAASTELLTAQRSSKRQMW